MRSLVVLAAAVAAMTPLTSTSAAEAGNPLLGEWRQVGERHPAQLGFRRVVFTPKTLMFDGAGAVAVKGYDVADGAVRVRTATGESYVFLVKELGVICMIEIDGPRPLGPMPRVKPGDRCFARQATTAS